MKNTGKVNVKKRGKIIHAKETKNIWKKIIKIVKKIKRINKKHKE